MLRVAVFCGGTGSIALQNGFASLYGIDRVQMDIIVNAYDNGKSTGVCRRCFNNEILGPSDVRKNQLLQYSIQNESSIKDGNNREARLFEMFNVRLSADCSEAYYRAAKSYMEDFADVFDSDTLDYLRSDDWVSSCEISRSSVFSSFCRFLVPPVRLGFSGGLGTSSSVAPQLMKTILISLFPISFMPPARRSVEILWKRLWIVWRESWESKIRYI
jgi:hypothetical protein